jgi:hypothetical protein
VLTPHGTLNCIQNRHPRLCKSVSRHGSWSNFVICILTIFFEPLLAADMYMDYLREQRNLRTRAFLSKSACGVKRAGVYHLFCLQNGSGCSNIFKRSLNNWGFFCVLTVRRGAARLQTIVQRQVQIEVDNVGAIFLCNNFSRIFYVPFSSSLTRS